MEMEKRREEESGDREECRIEESRDGCRREEERRVEMG